MTPRDKAEELVEKMWLKINCIDATSSAKQCALIAVDEIIKTSPNNLIKTEIESDGIKSCFEWTLKYWQEVRNEIEEL